ncbi:MAG: hypothetical protein WA840_23965 [Caulobacteraceae bacterium]
MRLLPPLVMLGLLGAPVQAREPVLGEVAVIAVHDGVNTVAGFATDGRAATIVRGWRDNGNAHGHDVYLVLLPLKNDDGVENTTGVVAFDNGQDPLKDTATASPFDGERALGAVRFARAKVDGAPATVMIRADLGETASGVLADHAPVDISVYRLESPGVDAGTTPDVFRLVSRTRPSGLFCNADMALTTVLHLPLPANYAGGKAPSGCGD